ncbi:MAG: hypothetical protein R3F59_35460 [Myxococcota bacterium]
MRRAPEPALGTVAAWDGGRRDDAEARVAQLVARLPCLAAPLDPAWGWRLHFLAGVAAWARDDEAAAVAAWTRARSLDRAVPGTRTSPARRLVPFATALPPERATPLTLVGPGPFTGRRRLRRQDAARSGLRLVKAGDPPEGSGLVDVGADAVTAFGPGLGAERLLARAAAATIRAARRAGTARRPRLPRRRRRRRRVRR